MAFDSSQDSFVQLRSLVSEDPKRVVFFVGAGASKWSGLPLWVELRGRVCDYAHRNLHEYDSDQRVALQSALRAARSMNDLWNAFGELKKILDGRFFDAVSSCLKPESESNAIYDRLWSLRPKGVVSFNLDKLALNSFSRVHSTSVDFATAREPFRYARFLSGTDDFVFLPHGIVTDPSTWVLDKAALTSLLLMPSYRQFIGSLLLAKTVVLIGFNPSDFAFSVPHLFAMGPFGEHAPRHFAITDAKDADLLADYRRMNFNLISYVPRRVDRHDELLDILDAISAYVPRDSVPPPASALTALSDHSKLMDQTLIQLPIEEQRDALNSIVSAELDRHRGSEDDQNSALQALIKKYPRAMQLAWMVDPEVPDASLLFGRRIVKQLEIGAFGRVFLAEGSNGTEAVKVLLQENKTDLRYLTSFRRGIQSMRILRESGVEGVVDVHQAYDLPACVFMEYLGGPTLEAAVLEYKFRDVLACLRILIRIGDIVSAGHGLPQRVFHRDLKPANIMFRSHELRDRPEDQIVVLDFDLSWHEGASGASVFHGARAQGYAAPEQLGIAGKKKASTRHTGVDVFGLGMLAFFVFTARTPRAGEQNFDDFRASVVAGLSRLTGMRWKSLVDHLSNLTFMATRDDQDERPGFNDMIADLKHCEAALVGGDLQAGDSLVLEELAQLVGGETLVREDFGRRLVITRPPVTLTFGWSGIDGDTVLSVTIERVTAEFDDRRTLSRYLAGKTDRARKSLQEGGFTNVSVQQPDDGVVIQARANASRLNHGQISQLATSVKEARRALVDV